MRLVWCSVLLFLLIVPSVLAVIEVEKIDKGSVVIKELNNPAVFDFIINNKGQADTFEIYSLVGVTMTPRGTFDLNSGKTTIEVRAYPSAEMRKNSGLVNFEYQIRGQDSGIFKDKLQIKIVNLEETLAVSAVNIHPDDSSAIVKVKNTQNTNLENVEMEFSSVFFNFRDNVTLKPYEEKNISVNLDKSKISKLLAGPYVIIADVNLQGADARIEGVVNYLEKEGTSVTREDDGIIVRKTTIIKKNEGNTATVGKIEARKNIFTRLFTTFSEEPDVTDRNGLFVDYSWEKNLGPSEDLRTTITTNYTFPFLLIIFVVAIGLFVRIYSQTNVTVSKRVSYVKTTGDHFALKVRVHVKAKNHVDGLQLFDNLPGMTKLYEKAGNKPDRIEGNGRRLVWNIDRLNAGEERVFSYVIYSNLKVVGRFELPPATAVYEKDGKTHESYSNRAYFAAETMRTDLD